VPIKFCAVGGEFGCSRSRRGMLPFGPHRLEEQRYQNVQVSV
jgi:hypothetical protein